MQWLAIVILSILACISYGIIHDQVTARICVEYFTIGHQPIAPTDDPTILGIIWGVVATWWVGTILGVPLATVSRFGSYPKRSVSSLYRPILTLMAVNAMLATCAGIVGYVAASNDWISLAGSLAEQIPPQKHTPFLVDLWAHNASYVGGFLGGTILVIGVWRSRVRASLEEET